MMVERGKTDYDAVRISPAQYEPIKGHRFAIECQLIRSFGRLIHSVIPFLKVGIAQESANSARYQSGTFC
jgi:hypothetical protein